MDVLESVQLSYKTFTYRRLHDFLNMRIPGKQAEELNRAEQCGVERKAC